MGRFTRAAFHLAGKLPLLHAMDWPFGKIEIVFTSNFRTKAKENEFAYLSSRYVDFLELTGRRADKDETRYRYNNFHYLQSMTDCDRLDIIGHGSSERIGSFYPHELAETLAFYSLHRVGVIKIQACYTGQGTWLEDFKNALLHHNISFAYIAAPMGAVVWNKPFIKYVSFSGENEYRVIKGNINKNFESTRYM